MTRLTAAIITVLLLIGPVTADQKFTIYDQDGSWTSGQYNKDTKRLDLWNEKGDWATGYERQDGSMILYDMRGNWWEFRPDNNILQPWGTDRGDLKGGGETG